MSEYADEGYADGTEGAQEGTVEDQVEVFSSLLRGGLRTRDTGGESVETDRGYDEHAEQGYSASEREQVAERVGEDVAPFVRAGIKLKEAAELPRPRELSAEEATAQAAMEVTRGYRERAGRAEATVSDYQTGMNAIAFVKQATDAYYEGDLSQDEAAYAHQQALMAVEDISDDETRMAAYAALEQEVDSDIFESHVAYLQQRYAAWSEEEEQREHAQEVERANQAVAQMEAVIATESQVFSRLSPLEQAFCSQLVKQRESEIAAAGPHGAQMMLRFAAEVAKEMAAQAEAAQTGASIVRAFGGQNKLGISGRDMREMTADDLGLANYEITPEMSAAAMARARAGVERDRQTAKRQWSGGMTGEESFRIRARRTAAKLGTPIK